MRSALLFITVTLLLSSCRKESGSSHYGADTRCKIYGLQVLVSQKYTAEEIDTVYITKYSAGTSFTAELEDTMLTLADADTLGPGYKIDDTHYPYEMVQGYDYEVKIPATAQIFRVQEIMNPPDSMGGGAANGKNGGCHAFIREYTVVGGPAETVGFWDKKYSYGAYGVVFGK